MFIAMNRFRIQPGREEEFEKVWRERETFLDGVSGFVQFHLLRGPSQADATLYVSHSVWKSQEAFEDWTRSEAFRKGHANARSAPGVLLGHPQLECFSSVL
jgi:heme-degrading monooxygenase HmoA